jgi:hypothetical protein
MAKIIPSALVDQLIGSIGSSTFRRSQFGSVAFAKQTPLKRASDLQLTHRALVSRLRAAWSQLSDANRSSWNQLSLQLQQGTASNGQYPRRPFELFQEYNFLPYQMDGILEETAPTLFIRTDITYLSVTWNDAGSASFVTSGLFDNNDTYFSWSISLAQRGSQKSAFTPFVVFYQHKPTFNFGTLGTSLTDKYGIFPAGYAYRVRLVKQVPGTFPGRQSSGYFQVVV